MPIFKLVSLFLLLSTIANAQKADTLRRKDAGNREFIQVRTNGYVAVEGNRRDGINEGVWMTYWDNGFPKSVTTYRAGRRDGVHLEILRTGVTEMMENYRDDQLEGPRRVFGNGAAVAEELYFSEGKKNGNYLARYPDGQKKEEARYVNDVRDGETIWYFENGQRAAVYNYHNGVIEGDVAVYHKNGKVNEFGVYKKDQKAGPWKEYFVNGKLSAAGDYVNGEKEGVWQQYDEDGKTLKPVRYRKGKANK